MLLFDGESHGSIHSCSFSRRNAVLKQTTRSTRPGPVFKEHVNWRLVHAGTLTASEGGRGDTCPQGRILDHCVAGAERKASLGKAEVKLDG